LVKIPQWLCKTTPFLPPQKQLCSNVLVHVSLNGNEQLLTPSLFSMEHVDQGGNPSAGNVTFMSLVVMLTTDLMAGI